jgi:hypothetical protein
VLVDPDTGSSRSRRGLLRSPCHPAAQKDPPESMRLRTTALWHLIPDVTRSFGSARQHEVILRGRWGPVGVRTARMGGAEHPKGVLVAPRTYSCFDTRSQSRTVGGWWSNWWTVSRHLGATRDRCWVRPTTRPIVVALSSLIAHQTGSTQQYCVYTPFDTWIDTVSLRDGYVAIFWVGRRRQRDQDTSLV